MPPTSTRVAGRYRLGQQLGSGGMGVVWEAYDELLHRTVAVKELRYPPGITDEERDKLARRTLREARAVAAVEDPHAVRVFDIAEQDGRPWIVMELVRGQTLTDALRERGALPTAEVVRVGLALLDALDAAHSAGVLHRDVKPSNVILGADGRIALTDFGIATVDSDPSDVTTTGQIVGSPAYMAPERARGETPTPAADLWSLGATLWTAAEGCAPYAENNAFATMTKVVTEEPPRCRRCDDALGSVIADLMDRDPAARPTVDEARRRLVAAATTATAVMAPYPTEPLPPSFDRTVALERAVPETPEPAPAVAPSPTPTPPPTPPTPPPTPLPTPTGRRRGVAAVLLALAAVIVVAAVIVGAVLGSRPGGTTGNSSAPAPRSSKGAGHSSPSSTGGAGATGALPSGWHRYTNPSVGWSIGVPAGWQTQLQGSEVFLRDPAGGRYLQIDTKYPAGPSAKGAWEDQERSFQSSHSGYRRIRLENVAWRGYPDVADWEFTYRSGAVTLHAVDRGAVVSNRGYGLFFQTHSDQWDSSQQLLHQLYDSFRPVG